ncbi:hypothetical protein CB457P1_00064 [Enterocloster phage CB457P1]|nr:hypothetical protein CB457P1_00064 [Enterocloster phage CB457P1]
MIKQEITTEPIDLTLMTGNYEINSEKMRKIKTNNHWHSIIELLKNEAEMIIDEDGFSHFKLELKDYLTLDEKIKLQNLGYGVFKAPKEKPYFSQQGDRFMIDNPVKYIIMW